MESWQTDKVFLYRLASSWSAPVQQQQAQSEFMFYVYREINQFWIEEQGGGGRGGSVAAKEAQAQTPDLLEVLLILQLNNAL